MVITKTEKKEIWTADINSIEDIVGIKLNEEQRAALDSLIDAIHEYGAEYERENPSMPAWAI